MHAFASLAPQSRAQSRGRDAFMFRAKLVFPSRDGGPSSAQKVLRQEPKNKEMRASRSHLEAVADSEPADVTTVCSR